MYASHGLIQTQTCIHDIACELLRTHTSRASIMHGQISHTLKVYYTWEEMFQNLHVEVFREESVNVRRR